VTPAPLLAALVVTVGRLLGWRGVDFAAQVYRVDNFRAQGLSLWDFQWYAGNWTLDYSFAYPALAATLGVGPLAVLSAAAAAWAFDRLVRQSFGAGAKVASLVFALGTAVQSAIGQLPFLSGEAFGLAACLAASRRKWVLSAVLALGATLNSPLAGAFVALTMAGWAIAQVRPQPSERFERSTAFGAAAVAFAALGPIVAAAALFPGTGSMPYPFVDYVWEMAVAAGICVAAWRTHPAIRNTSALLIVAATACVLVPSPIGGNIGRIEDIAALPLAVALLWDHRRLLMPFAAVPLMLSQWVPAWGAITSSASQPSTQRAYFRPLVDALARLGATGSGGRVEVVPTHFHWEAAYVAPTVAITRGWERQLDLADNPIFYDRGDLDAKSYRAWLLDTGTSFVALADAPLDSAGVAEGRLVASGSVPGLDLVWRSAHWRLYAVAGSDGIVARPAYLVSATDSRLVVDTPVEGAVLIRVRFTDDWTLSGAGCVAESNGPWILVRAPGPEQFSLSLSLLGGEQECDGSGTSAWTPPATTSRAARSTG
jgi:hypothetical protein